MLDGAVGADGAHRVDMAATRLWPEVRSSQHQPVPRVAAESLEELPIERRDLRANERPVGWPTSRAVDEDDGRHPFGDGFRTIDGETERDSAPHRMADDDCLAKIEASEDRRHIVDET